MENKNSADFIASMKEYNLINPLITFAGDFLISTYDEKRYTEQKDILYLNSLTDKYGVNLYGKLLNERFYNVFTSEEDQKKYRSYLYPMIITTLDENEKGRHLELSYRYSLLKMLESYDVDVLDLDDEKLASFAKDFLKNERKELVDIRNKKEASPFYQKQKAYFESHGLSFSEKAVEISIPRYTNIIKICSNIARNQKDGLTLKEDTFLSCFSYENFLLIYGKRCLDNAKVALSTLPTFPSFFVELDQIITNYYLYESEGFNPAIKYYDKTSKKIRTYTFKDLIADYNHFIEENKQCYKKFEISSEELTRLNVAHDLNATRTLSSILSANEEKAIETNWDIIPSGTKSQSLELLNDSLSNMKPSLSKTNKKKRTTTDILYYQYVLESTDYAVKIVGKDKFAGYIGYIYHNGKVLFEKLYENSETKTPAKPNATYIMNVKNFAQFCKLSKPQIIAYIRDNGNEEIERKNHSKHWETRIKRIVNGIAYDEMTERIIDKLLEQKKNIDEIKKGK